MPHSLKLAPVDAELFIDAKEILPAVYQTLQSAKVSIAMDVFLLGGAEGVRLAELGGREGHGGGVLGVLSLGLLAPAGELGVRPREPGQELTLADGVTLADEDLAGGVGQVRDEQLGHVIVGGRCGG